MAENLEVQVINWPSVKPTIGLKQGRPEFPRRAGATDFLRSPSV
jgi:hypothetical protein